MRRNKTNTIKIWNSSFVVQRARGLVIAYICECVKVKGADLCSSRL